MSSHPPDSAFSSAAAPPAKASWPLFTVAGLAFLPVIGLLFGALGLTWGLISDRPRAMRAALLAGGGAALNLALLIGLGVYTSTRHADTFDAVSVAQTRKDLLDLVVAIERYHEENAAYPTSLTALQRRPAALRTINIFDPMSGFLSPQVYAYTLSRDGRTYDLFSRGPDREPGTPDDVRPALPDSLAQRAGYRPPSP